MKKSISQRIKITRRGKIMRRSMNVNHFRTRKSKKNRRGKRKTRSLDFPLQSIMETRAFATL